MPGAKSVEMALVKANPAAESAGLDRMPACTDYFVGNRSHWRTGIANYARVQYRAAYWDRCGLLRQPGIAGDDFVVQPGADPRAIRLKFQAAPKPGVTPEGDLTLDFEGQRILQKKPVVYQDRAGVRRGRPRRVVGRNGGGVPWR